ncbi:MAG: 50S ribosomal protein L11 methyltransferase [Oscillospiraceae bacterium]|nr:50S ribosomal protein L11 methyltransferase [Oscillospiraceae bacterium]
MKWTKFTVKTTHDEIDAVCARLAALGYDQLEIEDAEEIRRFIEREKPFWQLADEGLLEKSGASVSFYVDGDGGAEGLDGLDFTRAVVCEEDWIDNWKRYYKPIKIGARILIQPEWEPLDNPEGRAVFWCDPGVSFGTGTHATTRLCLELLDRLVKPGDTVIDLGCGSGILSVTALLLGAGSAFAADIDGHACDIALRNAGRNGLALTVERGNLLEDAGLWERMGSADIVCANLVADLICPLARRLRAAAAGCLIASGILSERAGEVGAALGGAGFEVVERLDSEGWAALRCM